MCKERCAVIPIASQLEALKREGPNVPAVDAASVVWKVENALEQYHNQLETLRAQIAVLHVIGSGCVDCPYISS